MHKVLWIVLVALFAAAISSLFPVQGIEAVTRPTPTAEGQPTPTPYYNYLPVVSNGDDLTSTPVRPTPTAEALTPMPTVRATPAP